MSAERVTALEARSRWYPKRSAAVFHIESGGIAIVLALIHQRFAINPTDSMKVGKRSHDPASFKIFLLVIGEHPQQFTLGFVLLCLCQPTLIRFRVQIEVVAGIEIA